MQVLFSMSASDEAGSRSHERSMKRFVKAHAERLSQQLNETVASCGNSQANSASGDQTTGSAAYMFSRDSALLPDDSSQRKLWEAAADSMQQICAMVRTQALSLTGKVPQTNASSLMSTDYVPWNPYTNAHIDNLQERGHHSVDMMAMVHTPVPPGQIH